MVTAANELRKFPERFPKEPLLSHLPNNFRFVQKWNYKILYEFTGQEVISIDVFHTSRSPDKIVEKFE